MLSVDLTCSCCVSACMGYIIILSTLPATCEQFLLMEICLLPCMQSGTVGCQAAAEIDKQDTATATLTGMTSYMTGVVKVTTWSLVRTVL